MSTSSLTTTSVATESERAPSDTNIGWVHEYVYVQGSEEKEGKAFL